MQEIILNKAKELVKLLNERNMTITFEGELAEWSE